jgi:copper chaperone CopZ
VDVNIPGKQVTVEYDQATVDVQRLSGILEEEDYPVESVE